MDGVGENASLKLNDEGGIEIYVDAEKPAGVPEENWLPINRKDEEIDIIIRVNVPNFKEMQAWQAPKAETLYGRCLEKGFDGLQPLIDNERKQRTLLNRTLDLDLKKTALI